MSRLFESLTASDQSLADGNAYFNAGQLKKAKEHYERAHVLRASGKTAYSLALVHDGLKLRDTALDYYRKALDLDPLFMEARVNLGHLLRNAGRYKAARHEHTVAYGLAPKNPLTAYNLGLTLARTGDTAGAHLLLGIALDAMPDLAPARQARDKLPPRLDLDPAWSETSPEAIVEIGAGRDAEAIGILAEFLAVTPRSALGWTDYGAALIRVDRAGEAIDPLTRGRDLNPDRAPPHHNLGVAFGILGRLDEAIENYYAALARDPHLVQAWVNLAQLFTAREQPTEAWEILLPASRLEPPSSEALINFAESSRRLKRLPMALQAMEHLGQLLPDHFLVHNNRGSFLLEQGSLGEAAASFERAAAVAPDSALVAGNLGAVYEVMQRYTDALRSYRRASELEPGKIAWISRRAHVAQHLCAWEGIEPLFRQIAAGSDEDLSHSQPFGLLSVPGVDAGKQLRFTSLYATRTFPEAPIRRPPRPKGDRTRVGYLSADYHDHPTAYLFAEVLEHHDRAHFEVVAYSSGPSSTHPIRDRLRRACDRFVEVQNLSDEQIATMMAGDGIDVLVDMKGYTLHTRTSVLRHRPAPVQINYLGYPGTLGAQFADYILADPVVIPAELERHYTETVLRLPNCYQPNDRKRPLPPAPSRGAAGLPAKGFVFCSFNNAYKLTPDVFAIWARLLEQTPKSVLWTLSGNADTNANLWAEMARYELDPQRLVFAPRVSLADHLARFRLADLFLDTFPYTAHTTSSDALWCGVPVVTRMGETFASRVAASILHAAGFPELVTETPEAYEALALRIAHEPETLTGLKRRLEETRMTCALFDSKRYTRDLEAIYAHVVGRAKMA